MRGVATSVVSALVFTRTKHRARKLARDLERGGHSVIALQGNMSQNARDRAMGGFRSGRYDILVATDIAARGIDVEQISHVFNFDVPNTPDAYTHRIGRTGRAERSGKAYTFVTVDDGAIVRAIERKLETTIPRSRVEGFEAVTLPTHDDRSSGRTGSRAPGARQGGGRRAGSGSRSQQGRRRGASRTPQATQTRSSDGGRSRGEQDSTAREGAPRRRRRRPNAGAGENRPGGFNSARPSGQTQTTREDGERGQSGSATGGRARDDSTGRTHAGSGGQRGEKGRTVKGTGKRARRRRRGARREA